VVGFAIEGFSLLLDRTLKQGKRIEVPEAIGHDARGERRKKEPREKGRVGSSHQL
jgi:hypothetical protein